MRVVLAVNGEAVESMNMSNDCMCVKQSAMFYYVRLSPFILFVYSYLCYVELCNCLLQGGIRAAQKAKM